MRAETMNQPPAGPPEKARNLALLKQAGFNVPPFLYMPASDFKEERFEALNDFLARHCPDYKVITRSCHPAEESYKGGTFDSLQTYADLGGVKYARKRIIKAAREEKRLSILRQQKFADAPPLDLEDTGIMVMPFIEGSPVMAKVMDESWEFGYSRSRGSRFQNEPYITHTPHDRRLLTVSQDIERLLGFRCEIEYIVGEDGEIFVVQAKDISHLAQLQPKDRGGLVALDGLRRIRRRRNYRERPVFVMDCAAFYLTVISACEDLVLDAGVTREGVEAILALVAECEGRMEHFALKHDRFCVLGLSIEVPEELFQVANHYLDETEEYQAAVSRALYRNQYKVDQFLAEADTLIAKDKFRRNLCSHDAYGINTVRHPIWNVYWRAERHREVVDQFRARGYKTGDYLGIDVGEDDKPTVFRL